MPCCFARIICIVMCRIGNGGPEQDRESSLKFQTRCIACTPDGTGYALSSVEGRVAMEFFDPSEAFQVIACRSAVAWPGSVAFPC